MAEFAKTIVKTLVSVCRRKFSRRSAPLAGRARDMGIRGMRERTHSPEMLGLMAGNDAESTLLHKTGWESALTHSIPRW